MNGKRQAEEFLSNELKELRARDRLRSLELPAGVNLCSNDYLALSTHSALRTAVLDAIQNGARMASTGSRLLSGHAVEWEALEKEFAEFAGVEAALFFGSGYAANLGVLSSVAGKSDVIFSDALNHASLIDGIRLSGAQKFIYGHRDLNSLEDGLRAHAASAARKFIVTESLFSMDGDFAPLAEICALAERYGAAVIVDEAHAVGVFGPKGRGCVAEAGLSEIVFASIYPCGKALASAGAFVCGSAAMKEFLINRARTFIFSTALPPYFAAQISAALALVRDADAARDHLIGMAREFREALRRAEINIGASESQIVPVIVGDNAAAMRCAELLANAGFAARAIRPPTVPEGAARVRISLTCALDAAIVRRLATELIGICARVREGYAAASAAAR
ncbi:MAG TPA: 8-amino-7-oxononanoate synthase [Candidatus Acidoferrales bacterium]|nr:8-amino-7-oxononanoate synthase [Candidatus Acidoferrales bacterium]